MATTNPKIRLSGLARRLVSEGVLEAPAAEQASAESLRKRQSLVSYLIENKLTDALSVAWAASQEFGLPLIDLNAMDLSQAPVNLVEERLIRRHHALPLYRRGNRLFIAVADPTNLQALDEIKFHTGINTEAILAEEPKLLATIERALSSIAQQMNEFLDSDLENLDVANAEDEAADAGPDVEDAPVVRFVNKILLDAIHSGASDIHVEPYEHLLRIRMRIDGVLHEVSTPPVSLAPRLAARLKVMSRMDIAERRVPQDGRIKLKISKNRAIDFRVNTLPTLYGEKIVLRILDPTQAQIGIDALGYDEHQKKLYLDALKKPYGMILVTGPTGSGKTVSLYTGLNILNIPERNISTCEDPVEINLPGTNQCNMNPKTGFTFAEALRAFLRQDPDVIMVGEIRDLETAEIAVKAAQTGHLVLSTLHTNDAPQTLTRLANMGVPAFNIASAVHLIIAQRLARRLCQHCKTTAEFPEAALIEAGFREDELDDLELFEPVGCDHCNGGYRGRVGIFQVMPVSPEIGRIIMAGGNAMEIAAQAKAEGALDLRESGLNKVRSGITSLDEINRVTKD